MQKRDPLINILFNLFELMLCWISLIMYQCRRQCKFAFSLKSLHELFFYVRGIFFFLLKERKKRKKKKCFSCHVLFCEAVATCNDNQMDPESSAAELAVFDIVHLSSLLVKSVNRLGRV